MGGFKSRLFSDRSSGFALPEVLVSLGILGVALGLIGGGLLQASGGIRRFSDDAVATKDLRHAASWFSRDAPNAQTVDLADGAAPASSLTMSWTDQRNVTHVVSYSLVGDILVRDFDGVQTTVARGVTTAGFRRSGATLELTLTVGAAHGGTETSSSKMYARTLQ